MQSQKIGPSFADDSASAEAIAALGGVPTRPPVFDAAPAAHQPRLTGHPTFDPPAPELIERRQKIAVLRARLADLIGHICQDADELAPLVASLETDATALRSAEGFCPTSAKHFLAGLSAVVAGLSPKPANASKDAPAKA